MASAWDNLNADFASRLRGLVAESGGRITIVSGYRSPARQQQLFAQALAKYGSEKEARKWVAPPGKSNHNHGVAVDLGGDLQLAHSLAPKYGLVFPMPHEAWHIEPAGLRAHPDAYTTAPDDDMGDMSASDPTQEQQQDPVDSVMSKFKSLFDPTNLNALGEAATPGIGEGDTTNIAEGVVPTSQGTKPTDDQNSPMSGATAMGGTPGQNRMLGQKLAANFGWGDGGEWQAFNELVMRESGWDAGAANPTSSARGIAQNINGYSDDYQEGNAEQQINWMLNYVKNRYGSPSKAIAFHDKKNWY